MQDDHGIETGEFRFQPAAEQRRLAERRAARQRIDEITQTQEAPELKPGKSVVLDQRASLVGKAQTEPVDHIGDELPALLRVAKMQEQLLRIEGIIVQLIARLEVPTDSIKPIIEAVLLSALQGPGGIEGVTVQQGRELHLRLAVALARKAHPEIEIDIERALLHVDPVQADDVDPGIDHALNPVMLVSKGEDMALLPFRSEIDSVGLIDAHELQRRRNEPAVMEKTHSDRARNVAVRVEIEPPRQPDDRRFRTVDRSQCDAHTVAICNLAGGSILNGSSFQRPD